MNVMAMVKGEKGWMGFKWGSHRSKKDRENPLGNLIVGKKDPTDFVQNLEDLIG